MKRLRRWWRRCQTHWRIWVRHAAPKREPMIKADISSGIHLEPSRFADQMRLRRLVGQSQEGQSSAVELELHQWHRQANCPVHARLLLAGLLARRGEHAHARSVLAAGLVQEPDAEALVGQLMVSLFVADDLLDAAQHAADQLYSHHGFDSQVTQWIQSLGLPGQDHLTRTPQAVVDYLASELLCVPQLLSTLVTAQEVSRDQNQVHLLRRAGRLLWPDMHQGRWGLELCQAMARLAMLEQDHDDARQWIWRGLEIEPYSAALALLLSRLSDDPAHGPTSIDVLATAVAANPDYPDLNIALIRRQLEQGRTAAARRDWRHWLNRQPNHPLALALAQEHKELAA